MEDTKSDRNLCLEPNPPALLASGQLNSVPVSQGKKDKRIALKIKIGSRRWNSEPRGSGSGTHDHLMVRLPETGSLGTCTHGHRPTHD